MTQEGNALARKRSSDASSSPVNGASPIGMMAEAIEEHFREADAHFCQAPCAEDILVRMNSRALYIVTEASLEHIHSPCLQEIKWYRDALNSIYEGNSLLKPEAIAKLALDQQSDES